MKRKAVAFYSEDFLLKRLADELEKMANEADAKIQDLKKQALKVADDCQNDRQIIWQKLGDRLVELGKIPRFDVKKDGLKLDHEQEIILYTSREDRAAAKEEKDGKDAIGDFLLHLLGIKS